MGKTTGGAVGFWGEQGWGGDLELCGHLSWRCLFDIQVEILKKQLNTLTWHSGQKSELHR